MSSYSDYDEIFKNNKKSSKCSELSPCLKMDCPICQRRYRYELQKPKEKIEDKTLTFIIIIIGVLVICYLIYRLTSSSPQISYPFQQYQQYLQPPFIQPQYMQPQPMYCYPQHESPSHPIIIIQSPTPPSQK